MKTCICLIIKNEQDYLDDFLKYHINLGIDKIFVFEDVRSTSHKDIIDNYQNVELHSIKDIIHDASIVRSKPCFQIKYIKECLMWIKNNFNYDWCFILDCDEFITPEYDIKEILKDYSNYDALILQWKNFGYSGHIKKPVYDKPIWEIYTEECGYTEFDKKGDFVQKICFNMNKLQRRFICGNHHTNCNWVRTDYSKDRGKLVFDKVYLRHYITKSLEEYEWKLKVRGMMYKNHRSMKDFYEMNKNIVNNN